MGVSVGTIYPGTMGLDEITHKMYMGKNTRTEEMRDKEGDLKQPTRLDTFVKWEGRLGSSVV